MISDLLRGSQLVGEFLHCLRIFGIRETSAHIQAGVQVRFKQCLCKRVPLFCFSSECGMSDSAPPHHVLCMHTISLLASVPPCQFLLGCERRGAFVPASASYYKRYHAAYCGIIGLMPVTFDAPDDDGLVQDHRRRDAAFASAVARPSQAISSAADCAYLTFATATADAVGSQLSSVHRSRRSLQDMADYFL